VRQAELKFGRSREVYLVHRLDREASGLMLLAHTREAAARLSEIFRENRVEKRYRAEVTGLPATVGEKRTISLPLDGKSAVTEYIVESHDAALNRSVVTVWIRTGRLHQIRRHFDMLGCPVVGDPRYGRDNKNLEGLKLEALSLRFICPFRRCEVSYSS
jgi:tRNA pseudouridine32 synthase/23S rRNA pseudouridine746 synthase